MSKPLIPKAVRLQIFCERLFAAATVATAAAAKELIDDTLNAVEDELTDIPFDPAVWRTDGRLYPVQDDNAADVDGRPDITSYRSRSHETLIRENGAFEIRHVHTHEVLVTKPGSDGKGVWT